MLDVKVFTVASEVTEGYQQYIRSASYYNVEVIVEKTTEISHLNEMNKKCFNFFLYRFYSLKIETLGMNEEWLGGHMGSYGGGYKINLLRNALEPYKGDDKKIILFTDRYVSRFDFAFTQFLQAFKNCIEIKSIIHSYDVLFTTTLDVIVHKFKKIDARILFGAEKYIWPDDTLEHLYPVVSKHLPKYLNSGLFMGMFTVLLNTI